MGKLIAFYHPYFRDGGVERTNICIAKVLVDHGYEVEFITFGWTDHYCEDLKKNKICVVDLGVSRALSSIIPLYKYLNRRRPCLIISAQNYANIIAVIAVFISRYKPALVLSERNSILGEFNCGLKSILISSLVKVFYPMADRVIANSKKSAKQLSRICKTEVQALYNPTNVDSIEMMSSEKVSDELFGNDHPIICFVGRFCSQKDPLMLLKAFLNTSQVLDCNLLLIGDGPLKSEINKFLEVNKLEEKVKVLGFKKNPYKYMSLSRVFVLSSKYEGLPNVLIEAVRLKIPCVATDCDSGPSEILLEGKGGSLVEVGDYVSLSEKIVQCILNPEEARIKARIAFEHSSRFSPDVAGRKYLELIKEITK